MLGYCCKLLSIQRVELMWIYAWRTTLAQTNHYFRLSDSCPRASVIDHWSKLPPLLVMSTSALSNLQASDCRCLLARALCIAGIEAANLAAYRPTVLSRQIHV